MQMLTANRLTDGHAVWYAGEGRWVEDFARGRVAADETALSDLEAARAAALDGRSLVDLQLIDLVEIDGEVQPRRLREVIRAKGPTIWADVPRNADDAGAFERAA